MKNRVPAIFVSSTCYDLAQVRANIRQFVEELGFEPVLSEYNNFPIDPSIQTVDNCLKAVEKHADIYVLVIGGRYGSQNDDGKSITNLEYIRARAKGIPIYVFVNESILKAFATWKTHPERDFSSIVDSPKVFEFVETMRDVDGLWINPFEHAKDITNTLKKQFAYLFSESLVSRARICDAGLPDSLSHLKNEPLRLILDKPDYWEYRLFGEVLSNGVEDASNLRKDLEYKIILGEGKHFDSFQEIQRWANTQIDSLKRMASSLDQLMNFALQEAFGKPGQPGIPEQIIYTTNRVVECYREAIAWTIECNRVSGPDEFQNLIIKLALFTSNMISEIEEYSRRVKSELKKGMTAISSGKYTKDNPYILKLTLTLTVDINAVNGFEKELNRISRKVRFR